MLKLPGNILQSPQTESRGIHPTFKISLRGQQSKDRSSLKQSINVLNSGLTFENKKENKLREWREWFHKLL